MAETAGTLFVDVKLDIEEFQRLLKVMQEKADETGKKVSSSFEKVGKNLDKIGSNMTKFVTLPIFAAAGAAVKFGSDYEEALNKVTVAFGSSSDEIIKWGQTSLQTMGLARGTALDMAALYGDMATGMGIAQDNAATLSMRMVQAAVDLKSFKNVSIDVANTGLKAVFTGETESLKNMGIIIDQATLQRELLSQGINKNIKDLTQEELINLRLATVLKQAKNTIGDYANTQASAANQMYLFQQATKELAERFGQVLLPAFTSIITAVNKIIIWFGKLSEGTKKIIVVFAGIAASIGVFLVVGGKVILFISALQKAFVALNIVMSLNVFAIVVVAIIAFIGALVFLIKNFDTVKAVAATFWAAFKLFALQAFTVVSVGLMQFVKYFIKGIELMSAPTIFVINKMIEAINKVTKSNIPTLTAVFDKATNALDAASQKQIDGFKKAAAEHKKASDAQKKAEQEKTKTVTEESDKRINITENENQKILDSQKQQNGETRKQFNERIERDAQARKKLHDEAIAGYEKYLENKKSKTQSEISLEEEKYAALDAQYKKFVADGTISQPEEAKLREQMEYEHQERMYEIRKAAFERSLDIASQLLSQIGSIFDQYYKNQGITLDNKQKKEEDAVKKSALTEEEKQKKLDAIAEKYETKRKKLQRDQAKQQKVMSIFNATIATAQAVTGALGSFPWSPANIALAGIMGALGAAQIALIAQQPLPELAKGGLTTGQTTAIIGEAGQEAVLPLTNTTAMDTIGDSLASALARRLNAVTPTDNKLGTIENTTNQNNLRPVVIENAGLFDMIMNASKNGLLFIDERALI